MRARDVRVQPPQRVALEPAAGARSRELVIDHVRVQWALCGEAPAAGGTHVWADTLSVSINIIIISILHNLGNNSFKKYINDVIVTYLFSSELHRLGEYCVKNKTKFKCLLLKNLVQIC